MSYTTVLQVNEDLTVDDLEELRNSHGSAPVIWEAMCDRYLPPAPNSFYMFRLDTLWPIYKRLDIPEHHRSVLMMTYDRAYVQKQHFAQAAKDIRLFLVDMPGNPAHVNHWDAIAKIYESEPDVWAIGLHCTSVSENPFHGEWNEENEDYDGISKDDAFEVYDDLEALKKEAA